jgi:hypothetical protein
LYTELSRLLAEYQLRADQVEQASASIRDAELLTETTGVGGRIWQKEGHHKQARLCFERAIAQSRDQRARLFELHATRDCTQLSAETSDSTEVPERLRSIVDWFPATLAIPILAECRALFRSIVGVLVPDVGHVVGDAGAVAK